jgi:hypothetical protein
MHQEAPPPEKETLPPDITATNDATETQRDDPGTPQHQTDQEREEKKDTQKNVWSGISNNPPKNSAVSPRNNAERAAEIEKDRQECKKRGMVRLTCSIGRVSAVDIAEMLLKKFKFWPEEICSGNDNKEGKTTFDILVGSKTRIDQLAQSQLRLKNTTLELDTCLEEATKEYEIRGCGLRTTGEDLKAAITPKLGDKARISQIFKVDAVTNTGKRFKQDVFRVRIAGEAPSMLEIPLGAYIRRLIRRDACTECLEVGHLRWRCKELKRKAEASAKIGKQAKRSLRVEIKQHHNLQQGETAKEAKVEVGNSAAPQQNKDASQNNDAVASATVSAQFNGLGADRAGMAAVGEDAPKKLSEDSEPQEHGGAHSVIDGSTDAEMRHTESITECSNSYAALSHVGEANEGDDNLEAYEPPRAVVEAEKDAPASPIKYTGFGGSSCPFVDAPLPSHNNSGGNGKQLASVWSNEMEVVEEQSAGALQVEKTILSQAKVAAENTAKNTAEKTEKKAQKSNDNISYLNEDIIMSQEESSEKSSVSDQSDKEQSDEKESVSAEKAAEWVNWLNKAEPYGEEMIMVNKKTIHRHVIIKKHVLE